VTLGLRTHCRAVRPCKNKHCVFALIHVKILSYNSPVVGLTLDYNIGGGHQGDSSGRLVVVAGQLGPQPSTTFMA